MLWVVLHLWDLPESDADFAGRLEAVVVAADVVAKHGVTLAVSRAGFRRDAPSGLLPEVVDERGVMP